MWKNLKNSRDGLFFFNAFTIRADERYLERNREIALARLENRIVQALVIPKKRKPAKPTKASKERKLKLKKIKSEVKKNRQKVW